MAVVIVGDIIRVVDYMQFLPQPQAGINVHFYKATVVTGVPTTTQIAIALAGPRSAKYANCLSSHAEYEGCSAQRFMAPIPLEEPKLSNLGFPVAGLVAGDPLPPDKTGIITWKTGLSGRKYRGRSYIPFPGEATNGADGLPDAGYTTSLSTLAAVLQTPALVDDGAGNTVQLRKYVYHGRTIGAPYDQVTDFVVRTKWAVQHRRGDYGQANISGPFR